ncbi:uncharacterized protein B0I36DRAFT_347910 [Microdochium trichocladiopsis]|uniref:DUF2293 domain-containing protein n=1 Tax=Microdochium trichocladiopsis TaxID=1682393 RepID=A0A9P8Y839_9PEZI|nr:uncharacterized protein B0I36DRAFT_347910 [Microdochium trichocladiopsis]KAH7032733.1 hypothetical protein B0I36DRAFT_347910 [Microdochium trichocladiopsis]
MPSTYEYHEPTVPLNSAPPPGYRLVPKGNPYMTLNCRKQTHLAGQTVYNVVEKPGGKHMGIRVPQTVYNAVAASFAATKSDRADAVRRRDGKLEATYLETVLAAFPKAPRREVDAVVSRAMKKHSGRVGRTGQLSAQEKAVLGVLAHIRHVHSPYEKLLKQGVPRLDARRQSEKEIAKKAAEWGYTRQLRGSGASRRKGASQKAKMRKPARIPAANPKCRETKEEAKWSTEQYEDPGRAHKNGHRLSSGGVA